jgi:hypothetical protein
MKTNQVMQLSFGERVLEIEHKTKMGSLTELWAIGNAIRESKGLTQLDMSNYLRSQETLELVQAVERKLGIFKCVESTDLKNSSGLLTESIKSDLIRTKRGRYGGGTWTHIYILLDAAARMDADFKVKMFDILIHGKLLEWRDDSGDSFKALNVALDMTAVRKTGETAPVAAYIKLANVIRANVLGSDKLWNEATYDELKRRDVIERQLISILKLDLNRDFNHLLEIAGQI